MSFEEKAFIAGFDEEYCDQAETEPNGTQQPLIASKLAFYPHPIPFSSSPSSYSRAEENSGYIIGCLTNLSDYPFSGSIKGSYSYSFSYSSGGRSGGGGGGGVATLKSISLLSKQTAPFFIDAVIKEEFVEFEFSPTDDTLIAPIYTSDLISIASAFQGNTSDISVTDDISSTPQENTRNMSLEEQIFFEDTITFYDNLKACSPHKFSYGQHPLTGFGGTNTIIGKKGDSCQVEFLMPGMKMLCNFSAESIETLTSEKQYQDARNGTMSSTRMNPDECEIF